MSDELPPQILTPEQLKARRSRNVAIACVLAGMAVLFFVMTIVRLGGNVAQLP